ncbi:hypothetical protein IEA_05645 [Bacillus toyonensis]|nr:hypothetical protein IEA_05645 [Bacillus toyonensis]
MEENKCEYCGCTLSEWLYWRKDGKKYCSETHAGFDKNDN